MTSSPASARRKIVRLALALIVPIVLGATPAEACRCAGLHADRPDFDRMVDEIVASADVVAEGVVVQPDGPAGPAIFRPSRVLKGPRRRAYRLGPLGWPEAGCVVVTDCALTTQDPELPVGRRILLVLRGGPDVYEASRCQNAQSAAYRAAVLARFDRRGRGSAR